MTITGTATCGPVNAPCGLPPGVSTNPPAALADCYGLNMLTPQTAYVNGRPVLSRMKNITVRQGQCAVVDWQFFNPAGVPVDFSTCINSSSSSSSSSSSDGLTVSCDNNPFIFKLRVREMLGGGETYEIPGTLQPDNATVRFQLSNVDTECPGVYFAEAVIYTCVGERSETVVVFGQGFREFSETPNGAVDGTNMLFTLSNRPTNPAGVTLTINGLTQVNGTDFTVSGRKITMTYAPVEDSIVFVQYTQTGPDLVNTPILSGYCQYYSNTFYLTVDPGLFTGEIFGPPTIAEVRLSLRDSGPAESMLLNNLAFSDEEIAMAIARPVQLWNETPPNLRKYRYTTTTFPFRYHWLEAIAGTLFLLAAEYNRRNNLTYSAANVSVNDLDKEPQYEAAGQRRLQMFREFVRAKKSELNLNQLYGGIC
jgi:hypothetical protein